MKPTVELFGDGFRLFIPSLTAEGGHHVEIPLTLSGLGILRRILKERHEATRIGEEGSPVQAMIEAWLALDRKAQATITTAVQSKPAPDISGLNIGELDL